MTMKEGMMKGIAFIGTGKYAHVERPIPKIEKNHDVLIRILATSICGTDVHILATPRRCIRRRRERLSVTRWWARSWNAAVK